jgi:beta-glucosidase
MTSSNVPMDNPSIPVDAIAARAGNAVKVTYVPGTPGLGPLPGMQADFAATFYSSPDLTGSPVRDRVDTAVDLAKFPPPAQLAPSTGGRGPRALWSARWTASLTPSATGRYRFSLTGSGTARLCIDGSVVASIVKSDTAITAIGGVDLSVAKSVEVKIEYTP